MYASEGGRPWGWHRLTDDFAAQIVEDADLPVGALVFDIGAGSGALTAPLVDRGAQVVAVELHRKRAALLRQRFTNDNVKIVEGSASETHFPRRPFYVVSNPPFALTNSLLTRLTAADSRLVEARIVLQRTNARRWANGQTRERRWQRSFEMSVGQLLPRSAFKPRPSVDTAVLVIRRRLHR